MIFLSSTISPSQKQQKKQNDGSNGHKRYNDGRSNHPSGHGTLVFMIVQGLP